MRFALFIPLIFLSACAGTPPSTQEKTSQPLTFRAVSYKELPGWENETFEGMSVAFEKSCARIVKASSEKQFGPNDKWGTYGYYQRTCREFEFLPSRDGTSLRAFFEKNF